MSSTHQSWSPLIGFGSVVWLVFRWTFFGLIYSSSHLKWRSGMKIILLKSWKAETVWHSFTLLVGLSTLNVSLWSWAAVPAQFNAVQNGLSADRFGLQQSLVYRRGYVLRYHLQSQLYFFFTIITCFKAVKPLTTHFIHFSQAGTNISFKHSQSSNLCRFKRGSTIERRKLVNIQRFRVTLLAITHLCKFGQLNTLNNGLQSLSQSGRKTQGSLML